ncbi:MAG: YiiD C-terminal domain-containing protein [Psychrobium sp.]|nr:YiiD C-terminal domain-containing protein [Psychrobium sp.]
MTLSWQLVACDNLLLCQFMVSYEVRDGNYLVARNEQDQIVAAGLLCRIGNGEAQVDIVVAPQYRQQGIARQLVSRLISQADEMLLQRLTAHGESKFWLALGFCEVDVNTFAYILTQAERQLVTTWHDGIPVTKFLALDIVQCSENTLITSASMEASINVHQSMFAGAIYSQAVLTGWGLIHLRLQCSGIKGSIVLASGNIKYRQPITSEPSGKVVADLPMKIFTPLNAGEKVSIELEVVMAGGNSERSCATFSGRYVILPISNTD